MVRGRLAVCLVVCGSGARWRKLTDNAPWSARSALASVLLNESRFCVVGGKALNGDKFKDVWCSADQGETWEEQSAFPGGPRSLGRMEVVGNEVLHVAGAGPDGDFHDIWASSDLSIWELRNAAAPFAGRASLATAARAGMLFVVGGINYSNATWVHFGDVWASADGGRTWLTHASETPWMRRGGHSLVALENGFLVLTGGAFFAGEKHDEQLFSDAWMSKDDGRTWQLMTEQAPWGPRGYHSTVCDGNRVLLFGGFNGSYLNDIWESNDFGASWTIVETENVWSRRETFATQYIRTESGQASLVVLGGTDYETDFNDVWSLPVTSQTVV